MTPPSSPNLPTSVPMQEQQVGGIAFAPTAATARLACFDASTQALGACAVPQLPPRIHGGAARHAPARLAAQGQRHVGVNPHIDAEDFTEIVAMARTVEAPKNAGF